MAISDRKKLLELTYAEYEGIGTWYEYLAKYRIFKRLKLGNAKKILLAGLPQEYGVAADILLFAMHGFEITVIDDRVEKLKEFKRIAEEFSVNEKIKLVCSKKMKKFPFEDNSFDLVTDTEAIQRAGNYKEMIKEMERVSNKHVILFVPNAYYYSHYIITKIKTFKLREIAKLCSLKIISKGYVDRPPWPAGVAVSSSNISFTKGSKATERKQSEENKVKDNAVISIIKKIFLFLTPALVLSEIFYPSPLRELLSHMFYVHSIKKQ